MRCSLSTWRDHAGKKAVTVWGPRNISLDECHAHPNLNDMHGCSICSQDAGTLVLCISALWWQTFFSRSSGLFDRNYVSTQGANVNREMPPCWVLSPFLLSKNRQIFDVTADTREEERAENTQIADRIVKEGYGWTAWAPEEPQNWLVIWHKTLFFETCVAQNVEVREPQSSKLSVELVLAMLPRTNDWARDPSIE